jgi:S1-C subfamily serine protease
MGGRAVRWCSGFWLACVAGLAALAAAPGLSAPPPNESGIVDIDTQLGYDGGGAVAGTGLVLTSSGELLTNNHVIRDAQVIRVIEPASGRSFAARVVGYDVGATDLAVLQIEHAHGLATITPANSLGVQVGQPVTAIGNAGGIGGTPSVTTGAVVALHVPLTVSVDIGPMEQLKNLMETNAPLRPGDSGGPLLDAAGRVIGMDTAAAAGLEPGGHSYAIPIDEALTLAHQIEAGQGSATVHVGATPFLGVDVAPPGDGASGAYVEQVISSSPAARAGLVSGDIVTSLAGRRIGAYAAITDVMVGLHPGARVELGWMDGSGAKKSASVRLGSGPPQ